MAEHVVEEWDLWYRKSGAMGMPFTRGLVDSTDVMLVRDAPPVLSVTVRNTKGQVVASGADLKATDATPTARLVRRGDRIVREDVWPGAEDIGRTVLLSNGEQGKLKNWWNADDHSEWTWNIEFSSRR